jgi:hypothetical protein
MLMPFKQNSFTHLRVCPHPRPNTLCYWDAVATCATSKGNNFGSNQEVGHQKEETLKGGLPC